MRIIVVAGSKYQNFDTYEFKKDDYLIGIEDGAYEIIKRGFTLDLVLGDFDTTTHLDEILKNTNNVIKYPKEKDEIDLLHILDNLNSNGQKFMLSNVIESNGKENKILKEWMKKYNVHYIKRQYLNSSYQKKNLSNAIEILITNF